MHYRERSRITKRIQKQEAASRLVELVDTARLQEEVVVHRSHTIQMLARLSIAKAVRSLDFATALTVS